MRVHALSPLYAVLLVVSGLAGQTSLASTPVVTGLREPVQVTAPPGDEDRLFIVQRRGRVRILDEGVLRTQSFLDLRSKVASVGWEEGLLSLAFHPDYDNNGFCYVCYTRISDGATMLERYTVSATDPNVADPTSASPVLGPIQKRGNYHHGGCAQFGIDGYLYLGTGDGGYRCTSQDGSTLLGKMLRIEVGAAPGYTIPPTNPFVGNPSFLDEIWTIGWRNPWRYCFDRQTGDMYVGDVGNAVREEISFQSGSSQGGENYGWMIMEGTTCFTSCTGSPPCNDPSLVLPIHEYPTGAQDCAVIGGHVYRGCEIPSLSGTYFFADHCSKRIFSLRYDGQQVTAFQERTLELAPAAGIFGRISSFGEGARGEMYIVVFDGAVHKIVSGTGPASQNLGFGTIGSNGREPLFELCGYPAQAAYFSLRHAPPATAGALLISTTNLSFPFFFGTVVPVPPLVTVAVATDAQGEWGFGVRNIAGGGTFYGQFVLLDQGTTWGLSLSNALSFTP